MPNGFLSGGYRRAPGYQLPQDVFFPVLPRKRWTDALDRIDSAIGATPAQGEALGRLLTQARTNLFLPPRPQPAPQPSQTAALAAFAPYQEDQAGHQAAEQARQKLAAMGPPPVRGPRSKASEIFGVISDVLLGRDIPERFAQGRYQRQLANWQAQRQPLEEQTGMHAEAEKERRAQYDLRIGAAAKAAEAQRDLTYAESLKRKPEDKFLGFQDVQTQQGPRTVAVYQRPEGGQYTQEVGEPQIKPERPSELDIVLRGTPEEKKALREHEAYKAGLRPRGDASQRRQQEDETIEATAGDYLEEAKGDANKALVQFERDLRDPKVGPRLRRYAARIRQRMRERVRPGMKRDRLGEILGEGR